MRRAHLIFGSVGVLVFLATGQYMRLNFPDAYLANEALRYMYRANHVYVLLASLVNLVLAVNLRPAGHHWKARISRAGSTLTMASPVLLIYAFFMEVPQATPERVLTLIGIVVLAVGVLAQLPDYRAQLDLGE